jgi:hypothetical protein
MAAGTVGHSKDAPHVCPSCGRHLVQPVDFECAGEDHWLLSLLCPSCGWEGNRTLTETLLERLEDELEKGRRQVEFLLARMTKSNMGEYAERFSAALAADRILPEDF